MLALLAFVLALTLSFASNSFSERRARTLAEANAIGTAWLRAQAIGGPRGSEIARLLERYTHLRIDFVEEDNDPATIDDLNRRTNALQTEIWGHATSISRERTDPVVVSLMAALNDTFDMTTAARFAYTLRLPPQLAWLLFGMALMSMAALGYQVGLRGNPSHVLAALLTLMWTAVIVDILDLATAADRRAAHQRRCVRMDPAGISGRRADPAAARSKVSQSNVYREKIASALLNALSTASVGVIPFLMTSAYATPQSCSALTWPQAGL